MKFLVALDGSKFSEDILGPAKKLASRGGENVEIHLVHVLDPRAAHATWMGAPPMTKEVAGHLVSCRELIFPFGSGPGGSGGDQRPGFGPAA